MNTNIIRRPMNRNFRVKINRGSLSTLVGYKGLECYVGRERAFLLVSEAIKSHGYKWSWKSETGFKVTFYPR